MGAPRIGITSESVTLGGRRAESSPRDHVDRVVGAGGVPAILPLLDPSLVDATLEGVDGLLVTGGGDGASGTTERADGLGASEGDEFEIALVRAALEAGLPILGLGRGHHLVNLALGGTLQDTMPLEAESDGDRSEPQREPIHRVRIASGSLLASVVATTELEVNSQHEQAVELAGAGLQVVARSDGGSIEAVEGLGDLRVLGVQWHPERLGDDAAHCALFAWLVREAAVPPPVDLTEPAALAEVGPRPAARPGRFVA